MKLHALPALAAALILPSAAGEIDPRQIPSSAKWVLHADIEAMRSSETGRVVFERIRRDHGARLKAAERMFAFKALEDPRDITLFGDGGKDRAVALLDAELDQPHLVDIVAAADDYKTATHSGATIHSWTDKGHRQHAAFLHDGLLVFSRQRDLLETAIDHLTRESAGEEPHALLEHHQERPLVFAAARLEDLEVPADPHARLVRMMRSLAISATEADGTFALRLVGETDNDRSAERLRRMLDGVLAFVEAADPKLEGLDLASEVAVLDGRPGARARASLPVAQWLTLLKRADDEARASRSED